MKAMSMDHLNGKIGNVHAPCHVTGWYGSPKTTSRYYRPFPRYNYVCKLGHAHSHVIGWTWCHRPIFRTTTTKISASHA